MNQLTRAIIVASAGTMAAAALHAQMIARVN